MSASGVASKGNCSDASKSRVVGMVVAGANAPALARIATHGIVAASGLTANTPYYLSTGGALVPFSSLAAGDRVIKIGYALTANALALQIQDMGQKAA